MPHPRLAVLGLLVVLITPACGTTQPDSSLTAAGAVACADAVFWGTPTTSADAGSARKVTLDINQWLKPENGPNQLTLNAAGDDAPEWPVSKRILVVDPNDSEAYYVEGTAADEIANATRQPPVKCSKDT